MASSALNDAPFQLQVLALRHAQNGSLWLRRWRATAAHGLRSRVQLQLLWKPLQGSGSASTASFASFEGRWELEPTAPAANWDHSLLSGQADLTTGRKQAQWNWTEKTLEQNAQQGGTVSHFAKSKLARLILGSLAQTFSCQTRRIWVASGNLSVTDSVTTGSTEAIISDWSGAQGVLWSLSAERMPRSLLLWSHSGGSHGAHLGLLPGLSLSAAVCGAEIFARAVLQSGPPKLPFEVRWLKQGQELEVRILAQGKSTHAFDLESPAGLPADTHVSLSPTIEVSPHTPLGGNAGGGTASSGAFPDLLDLSLPLPGAQL